MPRSRRGAAVWRNEGWKVCAKQKVMPARSATSTTRSGGIVRLIPSASSTSAEPELDEAARLPCLTTLMPAAAHTIEAIVEMLTVCARSPPVPTMSRLGPATSIRLAWASIMSASPRISSTVSPLARSAMRNPATCAGLASAPMIWSMAQPEASAVRSCPASSEVNTVGHDSPPADRSVDTGSHSRGRAHGPAEVGDRARQRDRVEGLRHRQVGLRPRGEPAVLRTAGEHEHGRALEDLVLELAAQPQPTHRRGLAVQDQQVERTALHGLDHGRCGRALTPAPDLDVTRRTATHGHPDGV